MSAAQSEERAGDQRLLRKVMWRLLPLMMILMIVNQIDRSNIGFAALTMNKSLGLSSYAFGLAAGVFSLGYILFEIPSNLLLTKVGANVWIARIMLTWGFVTVGMAYVQGPWSFCVERFLLGVAEAGFQPGMTFYILSWIPLAERARFTGLWFIAVPASPILGSLLAGALLQMDGTLRLAGWQWIFVVEGAAAILLSFVTWRYLPSRPSQAGWLQPSERQRLTRMLQGDTTTIDIDHRSSLRDALLNRRVLILGLLYVGMNMGMYAANIWMPTIVQSLGPFSYLQTTLAISVIWTIAAIASILVGRHSDKTQERYVHLGIALLIGSAGFALSAAVTSPSAAIACLTVAVGGILSGYVVFWVIPGSFLSGVSAAAGIALINSLGNLGGFLGPFAVGWIRDTTGSFAAALQILAGAMALSGLISIAIRTARTFPRRGLPPSPEVIKT